MVWPYVNLYVLPMQRRVNSTVFRQIERAKNALVPIIIKNKANPKLLHPQNKDYVREGFNSF